MRKKKIINLISDVIDEKVKQGVVPIQDLQNTKENIFTLVKKAQREGAFTKKNYENLLKIKEIDPPKDYEIYLKNVLKGIVDNLYKK